ncbi:MAG TPA: leucine-rich repeat domain-containing protein [Pirellulales bacterium]|jgi:hypothetical protein|nr:leucine-rich repeat domain-containing protein [Pirellulales bacterium]
MRRPQFSLKTMLWVTTFASVGVALLVTPTERNRRAIAALEAAGAFIIFAEPAETTDEAFQTLGRWISQDYFLEPREVHLGFTRPTDATLAPLRSLFGMKELWLNNTDITDAQLVSLRGLTGLQRLVLRHNIRITDAGLQHLRGLRDLQLLDLRGTRVTDAGMAQLQAAMPNCQIRRSGT